MSQSQQFAQILLGETHRRLIEESIPRIEKCLAQLTVDEIWHRPNAQTVSVGNLVLHLCGNVRQWLIAGLGGQPDTRNRPEEFAETGPLPTKVLLHQLDQLRSEITALLPLLSPDQLTQNYTVQGFQETGVSILVHVVEHFSYHTGQISYAVKTRKNIDLGYYPDIK